MFSCKDQVKTQTKSEIEIKINVLNARNSTKIVEGSTLCIYETGEDIPCIPPILLEGKTVVVTLKKNKHYDFTLSSTENLASSEVKNFYLREKLNEINIIQLDKKLPNRPEKAPTHTR